MNEFIMQLRKLIKTEMKIKFSTLFLFTQFNEPDA